MKKLFFALILFCLILSSSFAAFPAYTDLYVNDFAGVLDANQTATLRNYLSQLKEQTTAEVVVVTVNSLDGLPAIDYATQLGQTWGVGKKGNDNGLVILYAKTENKIAVATGYGLEGILPDSKVGRILDEYYVPNRDVGDSAQGVVDATLVYVNEIYQNKNEVGATQGISLGFLGEGIFSIIFIIICLIFDAGLLGLAIFFDKKIKLIAVTIAFFVFLLSLVFMFLSMITFSNFGFIFAILFMLIMAAAGNIMGLKGSHGGGHWGGGFHSGGGFHGGGSFGGGGFGGGGASR
jgi:uncharacterized protein